MSNEFKLLKLDEHEWAFCKEEEGKLRKLEWKMYKELNGDKDVYELYKSQKSSSCHYGLQIDKFSNIFNNKICRNSNEAENRLIKIINNNIDEYLEDKGDGFIILDFSAKVLDRLIVGLGGHSVFETDIKLHHTYGIPYIPASAIKGCLRSHIIKKYFESKEKKAKEIWFVKIFGGKIEEKDHQGGLIFLDSYSQQKYTMKRDIMTPHYSKGYTEDGIINPIEFLAVENTEFRFVILIDKDKFIDESGNEILIDGKNIKSFIAQEMVEMLTTHGIGAKTSVGYGYFKDLNYANCLEEVNRNNNELKKRSIIKEKKMQMELDSIQEKQKLSQMTDNQKILYQLENSNNIQSDLNVWLDKIEEMDEADQIELAMGIREILIEKGKWEGKLNRKQTKKVERIKEILEKSQL